MNTRKKSSKKKDLAISAIDLFCGAGGLTHGLISEGIKVAAGVDIDPSCKYAYEANNTAKFILKDIAKLSVNEIKKLYPKNSIRVLAGCAPCQPFSTYTQGRDHKNDKKWGLLGSFSNLAEKILPEIITMENVPQLVRHSVYKEFVNKLESLGYHVKPHIVYCPDYGIPQTRKRLVLLASLYGEIELVKPSHKKTEYLTVRNTISHLPKIDAGEMSKTDVLHKASAMSKVNMQRIKNSTPGGNWKQWNKKLVAKCHTKNSGSKYSGVYGRMEWDKPSPTITTHCTGFGNGRFGHPEQNRALSLREAALLQTFPEKYKFCKEKEFSVTKARKLIGNAVPVKLGNVIAQSIIAHISLYPERQKLYGN
jgi:DNA (cytosine-5)-methyltransferase 1